MRLLIEDYPYKVTNELEKVLDGLFTLQNVKGEIAVSYVGYYYNPKIHDVVFVLPKVIIDKDGKAFKRYDPNEIVNVDEADIDDNIRKFLYEFAVWVHRAIVVFKDSNVKSEIVHSKQIESEGHGAKKKSNTMLDIILALLRFNKENKSFFTFILKNIHSGFNKINWNKTISRTSASIEGDSPLYLNPVNKKRQINFDEELIVIFFSILQYVSKRFGFKAEIPFGFPLINGGRFDKYIKGFGRKRLRQIKYKYFSDTALKLWNLCYAFFDKTYQLNISATQSEYLLVNSFHIVFEAIIDELIGDHDIPKGLQEQADGKLVDHFYTYEGLLINRKENNDIYYIGDSKYYKIGGFPVGESVYKQYTYARNVIQWNLNLFLSPEEKRKKIEPKFSDIRLRDEETEGYNVIPNFFISADIDPIALDYKDRTLEHKPQPEINRQFENRLFDRDTLILSHFDVNFLHIIELYAQNNPGRKSSYKSKVREQFRAAIQELLKTKFEFYALQAHDDVDAGAYFKAHFQDTLGKTFRPFANDNIYSLALDKSEKYKAENDELLARLRQNFFVVECPLGDEPTGIITAKRAEVGDVESPDGMGKFLTCLVRKEETGEDSRKNIAKLYQLFYNHEAEGATYVMLNMPGGDISDAKYLLPLIDNTIDGYYDIERISFGTRTKITKDGQSIPNYPTLRIKIGAYHPLEHRCTEGIVPRMANQIWSYSQLQNVMTKSDGYGNSGSTLFKVEEPEEPYGNSCNLIEKDYIENPLN